jgi:hypothetical protein
MIMRHAVPRGNPLAPAAGNRTDQPLSVHPAVQQHYSAMAFPED